MLIGLIKVLGRSVFPLPNPLPRITSFAQLILLSRERGQIVPPDVFRAPATKIRVDPSGASPRPRARNK
jgi:hypothetical protein